MVLYSHGIQYISVADWSLPEVYADIWLWNLEIICPHHMMKFDASTTIPSLIHVSQSHIWNKTHSHVPIGLIVWNQFHIFSKWHGITCELWVSQIMLQYIKLCSFLSALHIFYEILHGRNRQRLTMKSLFKCSRSIRLVIYTDYNFWLAYFGCADMFPQIDSINTNSLDYLEITHPVYQHQPLKRAYSTKYMRTMTLSPKYNI